MAAPCTITPDLFLLIIGSADSIVFPKILEYFYRVSHKKRRRVFNFFHEISWSTNSFSYTLSGENYESSPKKLHVILIDTTQKNILAYYQWSDSLGVGQYFLQCHLMYRNAIKQKCVIVVAVIWDNYVSVKIKWNKCFGLLLVHYW